MDSNGIPNEGDIALLVLSNDGNTGYVLLPLASQLTAAGELPPEHKLVLDSFQLVATNSTITNSPTSGAFQPSPF